MFRSILQSGVIAAIALLSACGQGEPDLDALPPPIAAAAPDLSVSSVNNSAGSETLDRRAAWRLLDQATFGPRMDDIDALNGQSTEDWIQSEMQKPVTWLSPVWRKLNTSRWNEYINAWWRNALYADDQLRQRVAFALSEIFVVSGRDGLGSHQESLANYQDILLAHAFGNYRDLIEAITLSPAMGEYLSMKGNRKADEELNIRADENYARELLQLFSIGLVQLNLDGSPKLDAEGNTIPTYDQSVVENFARVFTGWHFANVDDFRWPQRTDYITPMQLYPDYHDDGEKELLDGLIVPAGQGGEEDLRMALDNVSNHPNVGPFIARQLIQRLVTSNPSPEYVSDVAAVFNRNADGERGSLASTVQAILVHREARQGPSEGAETWGKVREPILRVSKLWRAFRPANLSSNFNYSWSKGELAQAPLSADSVFNYFRPDYSQPGTLQLMDLHTPELQIIDEATIVSITSRLIASSLWNHNYRSGGSDSQLVIDITRAMDLEPNRDALLDWLDLLLLGGSMSDVLREACNELLDARSGPNLASQRVAEAIALILTSPEAAIQY